MEKNKTNNRKKIFWIGLFVILIGLVYYNREVIFSAPELTGGQLNLTTSANLNTFKEINSILKNFN